MNKKGTFQDIMFMVIVVFALSIIVMIMFKVTSEVNDKLQESTVIDTFDDDQNRSQQSFQTMTNLFPGVINNMFLFLMVGLSIIAFVLASLVRVHPIFIFFFIFALVILVIISGIFSNVFQEAAANPEFTALMDQMVFMSVIMKGLPFIVGILGSVLAIVMYKTWKGGGL